MEMKTQSAAVMESTHEPEPVKHSSEEISNQLSQIQSNSADDPIRSPYFSKSPALGQSGFAGELRRVRSPRRHGRSGVFEVITG